MGHCCIIFLFLILCTYIISTVSFLPSGARWMFHRPAAPLQRFRASQSILSVNKFDDDIFGNEEEDDDEGKLEDPLGLDMEEDPADDPSTFEHFMKYRQPEPLDENASQFDMREVPELEEEEENLDFLRDLHDIDIDEHEEMIREELNKTKPDVLVPSFAVLYKLKPEYISRSFELATLDHIAYCKTFKRMINTETYSMYNSKGVVVLFAGLDPNDKKELIDEVDRFVEKDPLIVQEIVDTWNILDLDPSMETNDTFPRDADGLPLYDVAFRNEEAVEGEIMKDGSGDGGGDDSGDSYNGDSDSGDDDGEGNGGDEDGEHDGYADDDDKNEGSGGGEGDDDDDGVL